MMMGARNTTIRARGPVLQHGSGDAGYSLVPGWTSLCEALRMMQTLDVTREVVRILGTLTPGGRRRVLAFFSDSYGVRG